MSYRGSQIDGSRPTPRPLRHDPRVGDILARLGAGGSLARHGRPFRYAAVAMKTLGRQSGHLQRIRTVPGGHPWIGRGRDVPEGVNRYL